MFGNVIRIGLVACVFILLSGSYLASVIPAGPPTEVTAEVISRTARSGPTGNIGVIICKLESGGTVRVDIPPIASVRVGDTVFLSSHERYFLNAKYHFLGRLNEPDENVEEKKGLS